MHIFGFGNLTSVYNFLKSKIYEYKKSNEEEDLYFEEELTTAAAPAADAAIASFKSVPPSESEEENVIFLKWPLRGSIFMNLQKGTDNAELMKEGLWTPAEGDSLKSPDDADVLHIPEVINAPVLTPVMQNEKLMNVDILTQRGIFIGLSPVDMDWLVDRAPSEYLEMRINKKNINNTNSENQQTQTADNQLESFLNSIEKPEQNESTDDKNEIFTFESNGSFTDGPFLNPENTDLASGIDVSDSTNKDGYFKLLKKPIK